MKRIFCGYLRGNLSFNLHIVQELSKSSNVLTKCFKHYVCYRAWTKNGGKRTCYTYFRLFTYSYLVLIKIDHGFSVINILGLQENRYFSEENLAIKTKHSNKFSSVCNLYQVSTSHNLWQFTMWNHLLTSVRI